MPRAKRSRSVPDQPRRQAAPRPASRRSAALRLTAERCLPVARRFSSFGQSRRQAGSSPRFLTRPDRRFCSRVTPLGTASAFTGSGAWACLAVRRLPKTTVQEQGPSWKSGRVQNGVPHLRVSLMDVVVGAATCSAAAGAGDSGKSSDRPRRGGELFWPFFEGEPRRRKSSSSIMA